jgi:hypothetical protein
MPKVLGSHKVHYEYYCLLESDTVKSGSKQPIQIWGWKSFSHPTLKMESVGLSDGDGKHRPECTALHPKR